MPRANAADLRQFRELTLHLALRDIVSMNRWTLLGWAWPLTRQLAQLAVLVFVFSTALDLDIENYPVFVFSGLVAWSWFSSGLSAATTSLIARRHLVFQPRVPVAVLPIVSVVVPMFDALMAMPVLLLMLALTDGVPWTVVLLPGVILLQLLIMCGLAWGLSGAAVYLRDVGNIVGVGLTMLFYMTPVFYDRGAVPGRYQWILGLNPVTPLIETYRDILLLGEVPPFSRLAALLAVGILTCIVGYALFRRLRGGFVDEAVTRPAIDFDGVWKSYPRWGTGGRTVRGIFSQRMPLLARGGEIRWALRDVSVRVPPGGSVGLIGGNGAGKSTMLRLASGLGRATRGRISIPERSASVLTLGDAFDFSLTGRENALTAAIVAGMSRAQARARIPAILEFAELEAFADAPMRTYSDGMRLRLAFGVLAQLEPQALLLDEVIAVGDMRFQAKCMERIRELRSRGTTVLFASHDLHSVASECDHALWLQAGTVRSFGDAATVVGEYRDAMRSDTLAQTPPPDVSAPVDGGLELRRNRFGNQHVTIDEVVFRGPDAVPTSETVSGAPLTLGLTLRRNHAVVADPIVGVAIHRVEDGLVCWDGNTEADGMRIAEVDSPVDVELTFTRLDLLPGEYLVDVGVYDRDWNGAYDFHWQAYPLKVVGHSGDKGVFRPPHGWRVAGRPAEAGPAR